MEEINKIGPLAAKTGARMYGRMQDFDIRNFVSPI
jgi:hypothetical protein